MIIVSIELIQMLFSKKLIQIFRINNKEWVKKINHYLRITKVTTLVLSFTIMPIWPVKAFTEVQPVENYKTAIVFDKNNPDILVEPDLKKPIEAGQSNYDLTNKTKIVVSSVNKYPDAGSHSDPTEFRPIYYAAAVKFGIPWQLIEAVHQVETGKSGSTDKRSYAGATGPMQFMPGTWRAYGVDGDLDGTADITNVTDAIYTAAHYLAKSGADEGRYKDALFNYNHSQAYVNKVINIAYEIGLPK
ncbi:MAG: lytic transglycosylase domain-containing protein [Candidatus Berkelbacteria bacterium]